MREISTHVDINADASLVWDILTDFPAYRRWNPSVRNILGAARRGGTLLIVEGHGQRAPPAARAIAGATVRRTVKHVREPRELYWLGAWGLPSLFSSERRFRIESMISGGVRFHQTERFSGAAVPFLWSWLRRTRTPAFQAMNAALKVRAERAEAEYVAVRTRPAPAG